ncbi:MAG: glycosyltransferase [Planctomycetes bacterium]|nr:glycosyltransferase [Planctomycetota bacterium]
MMRDSDTSIASRGQDSDPILASHEFDVSLVVVASDVEVDLEAFGEMVDAFDKVFCSNHLKAEFLVVDDGIGGAFFEALTVLNREVPNFKVIRFRRTFGESVALRIATERARGEFILTNTWYLQVKAEAAIDVIRALRDGADLVAARRTPRIDSWLARIQSWIFNKVTKAVTKVEIHDLNCSFRGFRKSVIESVQFHGDLFRFVPVLAVGQGYQVREVDVLHMAEKGPSTFLNFGLYVRRFLDIFSLFFLLKFIRKPLRFFGFTGITLFLAGLTIVGWISYERLSDKGVGVVDRPAFVLGVLLMVLGPILLSIGLIGEIIIFTHGKTLSDYHIGAVLGGREEDEDGDDRDDED